MKLESLVSKHFEELNPNDMLIWQYIYQHKEKCVSMSIEALAGICNVSRSTVMRFAQKIGLTGYSELKTMLRWENEEPWAIEENLVDLVCDTNIKTIQHFKEQNFDEACHLLYRAKRIFCYGTGRAQKSVVGEFQRMMLSLNILVYEITGEGELRKISHMITSEDLVIIISKTGQGEIVRDVMFELNSRDIPVVSLTRYGKNPLAQMSTCNLFVNIEEISLMDNTNYESMILMFLVLEIFFAKFVEYRNHRLMNKK